MGHQRDHAIIVSSHDFPEAKEQIEQARKCAEMLFDRHRVSNMIGPEKIANGRMSFFVAPDGSKEGWSKSNKNDALRHIFCDWLQEYAPYVKFVEVSFADEASLTPSIGRNSEENVPDDQRGF